MITTNLISNVLQISANPITNITTSDSIPLMQVFDTSGTFTVPTNVTRIMVEVWGGGGGGGSIETSEGYAGGGGGGYSKGAFFVTPGTNYTVTVGTGGAPSSDGGTSSFGNLIAATGGGSGLGNPSGFGGNGSGGQLVIRGQGGGYSGGQSPNGGSGGEEGPEYPPANGQNGSIPGGGGGEGGYYFDGTSIIYGVGGQGGNGMVIVYY